MKRKFVQVIVLLVTCLILITGIYGCSNAAAELTLSSTAPSQSAQSAAPISENPATAIYAKEIIVFAAAGTKPAIDPAAVIFEQNYGTKVTINYGGGGEVLSNMVLAKKGDVYIAPEQRFINSAKQTGAIESSVTPASLAYMIPVIGVQEGNPLNIQSLSDLAGSGLKIVMGNPDTTALGDIAPQMLEKAGIYDAVKPNIVTNASQVGAIITMLKSRQVDAGVIWHYYEIASASEVDIIWIPREYVTGIGEIQAAVSAYCQETVTAELFINFLISSDGQAIFKKNGYIVDRQEAARYWLANP